MSTHALGIMVSADGLYAVLLERTDEETVVQFRLSTAQTEPGDDDLPFDDSGDMAPGMEEESDDVNIQFGDDGGGGGDMFMGSEFDEIDGDDGDDFGGGDEGTGTWNLQADLDNILEKCAERGYEDPEIAFCTTTDEIDDVELRLPPDESAEEEAEEGKQGPPLPAAESTLLGMLEDQYEGKVEEGRVGFVPMHRTGDGRQRVLALIARPGGPVLSTLSAMQEQTLARSPRAQLLDAEVSLYLGLARSILQLPPGTPEKTILVRSSPEDTLVLFIEGNTLRQSEHLPEITSDDSAETICSRVLLLQDEYGMGEVQHLMLMAENDEEVLADAFKSYFGDANLRLLRAHLPGGKETDTDAYAAATGAALRLLDDPGYAPFFRPVNLLAKEYTASSFRLPVGWSVPALLLLMALTTLGFVYYFFVNASAINERRAELRTLEREVKQVDQQALQRRIDSLQAAAAQYAEGNEVMGRLLRGSNKWSDGLATVTGRINNIQGLSIDQWSPEGGTEVTVTGRSTTRSNVVDLAQQLEGEIRELTFTETRDVSLYDFQLTVPLDTTKPAAIEYWREQEKERLAAANDTAPSRATAGATPAPEGASPKADVEPPAPDTSVAAASVASTPEDSNAESESAGSGWTLVVASLAESAAAEEVAQRFRDRLDSDEHPVQIRSTQNGRYRVGVGQFSSAEAARSVLRDMNGVLPEEAWLLRLSEKNNQGSTVEAASPAPSTRSPSGRSG